MPDLTKGRMLISATKLTRQNVETPSLWAAPTGGFTVRLLAGPVLAIDEGAIAGIDPFPYFAGKAECDERHHHQKSKTEGARVLEFNVGGMEMKSRLDR